MRILSNAARRAGLDPFVWIIFFSRFWKITLGVASFKLGYVVSFLIDISKYKHI
jgi:hypothetical protein